jgi:aspartyl protease family protein
VWRTADNLKSGNKHVNHFWLKHFSRLRQYVAISLWMLLGLLLLLVVSLAGRGVNPNPDPVASLGSSGIPQVVLKQNDVNQYVANGRINGEPVEFLVDTGAVDVAMPYAVAQRLNLQLSSGGLSMTGNGNVQSWTAQLKSVDVGGLVASRVKAVVLPNMQGEQVLLGMSYLRYMELVLAGGELTLRPYVSR